MNTFWSLLKGVGVLLSGYVVVVLVNLPHDALINYCYPGAARATMPLTAPAEVLSAAIAFVAGVAAGAWVSLVAGRHRRRRLLLILTGLFLLTDLLAVIKLLGATSLAYRLALVALVPLEVWTGHRLAQLIRRRPAPSASAPS